VLGLDWSSIPGALPILGRGMVVTFQITATAIGLGIVLGTLLAMARLSGRAWISAPAAGYVNLFRSVPFVMVILWFYLIVPQLLKSFLRAAEGADTKMLSALTAFVLFQAAYYAEIIRAGIQSVPKGQASSAYALGMTYGQTMRLVVLPQAFRNMLPVLLTQSIILFQDTSLVYVIGLADYFTTSYTVGVRDGRLVELLLFAGAVYFTLCYSGSLLVARLQGKPVR
jgi:glutamate/aspartate transport system permease protein